MDNVKKLIERAGKIGVRASELEASGQQHWPHMNLRKNTVTRLVL